MFKRHLPAIILAMIVGFLFLMPQLIFQLSLGDKFQGVYRGVNDDELYYMARAQETVDGHYFISHPYFAEYKDDLPMQVYLPDLILAWPAKILNIGVYPLYEFYDFFLPAAIFFLAYLVFYLLTHSRFWSLYLSSWIFLIKYFFAFNRPISPQFVFIFAVTLILALLMIIKKPDKKSAPLIFWAAINFGFLFHIYPYLWTYFSTVLILIILFYWWRKNFVLFKKFLIIFISGLIIGLPYFYQSWLASQAVFFQETASRLGMIYTRFPSGIQIVVPGLLILALLIYLFVKNRRPVPPDDLIPFFAIAITAAIINVNQHLITGKNFFFSSHYEIISYLAIVFAAAYLVFRSEILTSIMRARFVRIIALMVIIASFVPIFNKIDDFNFNEAVRIQKWRPVFDWLNENTKKDEVVMADDELSAYLPSYTHDNVFFSADAKLYFGGTGELLDRFALNNYWRDFDDNFVRSSLLSVYGFKNKALAGRAKQMNKLKKIFGLPPKDLAEIYYPPAQIKSVVDYHQSIKEADWLNGLKKYQVSYLVVDNNKDAKLISQIGQYKFLAPAYQFGQFSIYQVNNF